MRALLSPHLLLLIGIAGPPAASLMPHASPAAETAWRVRPESPEYCAELVARLARTDGGTADPARSLGQEGARLCQAGHTRTGIAKLRRAIREAQSTR
ncbi:hypothetical protein LPC08_12955 [Roseomonas sp. OT10]|uniref:hypothetical protein n=1 Tax=Roseomonas cutis TaxID=2897332 RepID=UPI001E32DA36|nr:hypothetical protein [Roseomonas sp. OT10]UFN46940.1 hypothetical protein LPC08_12955 [Roseomonas sp. OT10]